MPTLNHVYTLDFTQFPKNKLLLASKYLNIYAKLSIEKRPKECKIVYDSKSNEMYIYSENILFSLEKRKYHYFKKLA